jgi:catalase (peroxidase I)
MHACPACAADSLCAASADAAGGAPWPNGEPGPGDHLRKVFYRMGFNDQEIVALSGPGRSAGTAHPLDLRL